MPTYAVKIGEVVMQSDRPISVEERSRAIQQLLRRDGGPILYVGGKLEVVLSIDGNDLKAASLSK